MSKESPSPKTSRKRPTVQLTLSPRAVDLLNRLTEHTDFTRSGFIDLMVVQCAETIEMLIRAHREAEEAKNNSESIKGKALIENAEQIRDRLAQQSFDLDEQIKSVKK